MLFTVPCCRSGVVVALFGGRVPEIRTGSAVEKSELNALLTRHKIYIYIYLFTEISPRDTPCLSHASCNTFGPGRKARAMIVIPVTF